MKRPTLIFAAMLAVLLLSGCHGGAGFLLPGETTKYSIENTQKFAPLDRPTQAAVTCTGLQEHVTSDGRLEVVVNLMNREDHRIEGQVRCVFKDNHGFSTGDETPWQTLTLEASTTEARRYAAANRLARKYTIAVREVH